MIATFNKNENGIDLTGFVPKEGKTDQVKYLYNLYSTPNFEIGYLQYGRLGFCSDKPEEVEVTDDGIIKVHNQHSWGNIMLNGHYPVQNYTTKARYTMLFIREILEISKHQTFHLRDFFENTSKKIYPGGIFYATEFDLETQIQKLEYILANEELAMGLLQDAYLDFRLFVNLLSVIKLKAILNLH